MHYLVGSLAVGSAVSTGLNMLGGILVARLVAPATLGLLNGITLVQGYAPLLQLGILNGLNRDLPYYIGKGERQRAHELAAAAQAWALALGGAGCLGLLGVAAWQLARNELWLAAGWLANAILIVTLFYKDWYLNFTFRTSHDFTKLAVASVVQSAANVAFLVLVVLWSFYGLCLRSVLVAVAGTALLHYWRPLRVGPRWNFRHLKHLLYIGAPIYAVGQLYTIWTPLNSTLVLEYTGTKGLGLYSIVFMAVMAMDILPNAVAQVIYPRMCEQFGRTEKVHDLFHMVWRPTLWTVIGLVPVIAAAEWVLEPVVRWVTPAYVEAVPAVRWGILMAFLTSVQPVTGVFAVLRRQDLYAVAVVLGIASYYGSLMWLLHGEVTLTAFPQAMLLGRAVYLAVSYGFLLHLSRRERARDGAVGHPPAASRK